MDENTFSNIAEMVTIFFVPFAIIALFKLFRIVARLIKKTEEQGKRIALLEAKLISKRKDK
jgi:hypothetical protein